MPEMFACLTKAGDGGKTRFSCSTDSIMDDAIALLLKDLRKHCAAALLHCAYANTSTKSKACKGAGPIGWRVVDQPHYPLEPLFGRILSPFEQFLQRTTAGGIVLVATTIVALGLATAVGADAIERFTGQPFALSTGSRFKLELSLQHWVNDGLMTLFFLLVGLELKREMLVGELASIRDAVLPVAAALGGMLVPALLYSAFNAGTPGASGWGIPMATDIAFAVGILVLLAWRIPKNLIIFLTALAIADDLGAVVVIALFYTADLQLRSLGAAVVLFAILLLFNRGGIRHPLPYWAVGVLLWVAAHDSGVHATLAGI